MLQPIEITSTPVDTDQQAGGCCGGACHTDAQATATESGTSQSFAVEGMTCGHCVSSVTEEISELAGVEGVDVVVETGAVTVTSAAPLDESAVRAAVEEAGYALA